MASGEAPRSPSRRAPELLVPFVGLITTAVALVTEFVSSGSLTTPIFVLIAAGLVLVFLVGAALIWRRSRVGYIVAIAISAIFLFAFGIEIQSALTGFADITRFSVTIIVFPALLLTLVYSILGVRLVWRKDALHKPGRMIPLSSVLAIVVVGFVIGGASIGILASGVITTIGGKSNPKADVTIVLGAANSGNAQPFMPATFPVKVGMSVTWVNKDTVTHTVTSTSVPSGAKEFDSGSLPYLSKFTVTFTTPGTYQYYCSLHPFMKGEIVVTP